MKYQRLLAVDPSLTCSGWAILSVKTRRLIGIGKIKSLPPCYPLAERLRDLQSKILLLNEQLNLKLGDVLICEAATTIIDPKATFKLEQVRAMFETLARNRGAIVPGRVNPHSVHREVLGMRGKQLDRKTIKAMAVDTACRLYERDLGVLGFKISEISRPKHQDMIDAILLAHLSLAKVESGMQSGTDLDHIFSEVSDQKRYSRKSLRSKAY